MLSLCLHDLSHLAHFFSASDSGGVMSVENAQEETLQWKSAADPFQTQD